MIEEAEATLAAAALSARPGRFQLETAIQSVHARRAVTCHTDWEAIALLYEGLIRSASTIGARVGHAAALAEARGAQAGLGALRAILSEAVKTYQPYWAPSAHLLTGLGQATEARHAYTRAVGLSEDAAVREFLVARSRELGTE
jgi:RNA polymerase sigma-70 factor (ECF subfamily)